MCTHAGNLYQVGLAQKVVEVPENRLAFDFSDGDHVLYTPPSAPPSQGTVEKSDTSRWCVPTTHSLEGIHTPLLPKLQSPSDVNPHIPNNVAIDTDVRNTSTTLVIMSWSKVQVLFKYERSMRRYLGPCQQSAQCIYCTRRMVCPSVSFNPCYMVGMGEMFIHLTHSERRYTCKVQCTEASCPGCSSQCFS
jgi:hypothetical protein